MSNYTRSAGSDLAIPQTADVGTDTAVSQRVLDRIRASVAENTRRAYEADWRAFATWCAQAERSPLPATPETLAEYASFRADAGAAPASIMRCLASIRVFHEYAGHRPPPTTKPAHAVIKAYRNERASKGLSNRHQAKPLSIEQLRKMCAALNTGDAKGARDRLVLVLGWAMMARRSELIGLNIADITENDAGMVVLVRKSKTDQAALGRNVAIPHSADPGTCPVLLTRAWLALLADRGITEGPLIRRIDKAGRIGGEPLYGRFMAGRTAKDLRISAPTVGIILRRAALAAGISPKDLSPHSLRAGGATAAYIEGADLLSIGRHGGWDDKTTVLPAYIRNVDIWKKNPMQGVL